MNMIYEDLLRIDGISFSYGARPQVLHDVTFSVSAGEIVGLVGPNGSGKSTLIKLIFDLLKLFTGQIDICGESHSSLQGRRQAHYLSSNDNLPDFLRGKEYLRLTARLFEQNLQDEQIEAYFSAYGMTGRADHLIEDYSHGMRKKTQLISAFLLRRPLTVIDETLNGIDIEALYLVEQELLKLRSEGLGVLLCSHDFALLERIADRIVFLDLGRLVVAESVEKILQDHSDISELVRNHIDNRAES